MLEVTVDDNEKAVAKAMEKAVTKAVDTKGNYKPKSKTAGKGTRKVDSSKKRSKTGEGK